MPDSKPIAIGTAGEPGTGPWIRLELAVAAGQVTAATFQTYPCPHAHRCAEWVCRWAAGRRLAELRRLEPSDLATVVGNLPPAKEHCADLTVAALRCALADAAELEP